MSPRAPLLRSKRSLIAMVSVAATLTAVVAVALVTVLAFRSAHAGGTGGGGCITAGTVPACHFSDNTASVEFSSVSSDGCIFTDAQVTVYSSLTTPGRTAAQSVTVFMSKWDDCNQMSVLSASNFDPSTFQPTFTGTIQLSSDLSTATVDGTATMFNWDAGGQQFTTTINLTFKGYGPTNKYSDIQHYQAPGFIMDTHYTGTSRSAEVSGTLTDDGGNNLAVPTTFASLVNSKGGTVQIFRD